jgi:heat shock protein HslJ
MRFEDGRITGRGACNDLGLYYLWRYTDSISVFGGDKTMMACEPELRMNWDDWFVAAMLKVKALNMPDPAHLELRCNDGGKVFFRQTTQIDISN